MHTRNTSSKFLCYERKTRFHDPIEWARRCSFWLIFSFHVHVRNWWFLFCYPLSGATMVTAIDSIWPHVHVDYLRTLFIYFKLVGRHPLFPFFVVENLSQKDRFNFYHAHHICGWYSDYSFMIQHHISINGLMAPLHILEGMISNHISMSLSKLHSNF